MNVENIQEKDGNVSEVIRHREGGFLWWWQTRRGGVCPPRVW